MDFFSNEFVLAFYGWLAFNFLMFSLTKDATDESGKRFQWKTYRKKKWDNWVVTLLFAPIVAVFAPDITESLSKWLNIELEFKQFFYLGVGVLVELIYMGIKKFKRFTSS